MEFEAYLPVVVTALVICGGIAFLRVFFTLWAPVERLINGDRFYLGKTVQGGELKGKTLNIHLKSQTILAQAAVLGFCSTSPNTPYEFRHLLMVQFPAGKTGFVRLAESEYLEEA